MCLLVCLDLLRLCAVCCVSAFNFVFLKSQSVEVQTCVISIKFTILPASMHRQRPVTLLPFVYSHFFYVRSIFFFVFLCLFCISIPTTICVCNFLLLLECFWRSEIEWWQFSALFSVWNAKWKCSARTHIHNRVNAQQCLCWKLVAELNSFATSCSKIKVKTKQH